MSAADDLRAAADLIRTDGCCKHAYCKDGHDISGALAHAASDGRVGLPMLLRPDEFPRWRAACLLIHQATGCISIDAFNDDPDTTEVEVLAALESAAVLADGVPA
jgi:hypothetical protein